MNELALFSGAGGSILAGKLLGWRTVCAVENDRYCQQVLLQRQRDGILPLFPIWDDVRTFRGHEWRGRVDVVTAGFPCQPFSRAYYKRGGEHDSRNLWPETIRVICQVRPRFALLENSPNLLADPYALRVFGDLAEVGYCVRWDCLAASTFGAIHRRQRLWVVADSHCQRLQGDVERVLEREQRDARHVAGQAGGDGGESELSRSRAAAAVCRKRDAVAGYVDRLRALGNGWVPIVGAKAWEMMTDSLDTPSQID